MTRVIIVLTIRIARTNPESSQIPNLTSSVQPTPVTLSAVEACHLLVPSLDGACPELVEGLGMTDGLGAKPRSSLGGVHPELVEGLGINFVEGCHRPEYM